MSVDARSFEVGLGLGSNLGDKAARIRAAVHELVASDLLRNVRVSSLYRTDPWGYAAQDWFVNACAVAQTRLRPRELLALCQAIEVRMGREPAVRWGPRVIDIDILYYDSLVLEDPDLHLPHVELLNRAFVLVPLAELRPDLVIGGRPIGEALARLDLRGIERVSERSQTEL